MNDSVSVLVVEDEMIIAAKICLHLEQLGYAVAGILPRGEEAVVHCRQTPPDLLLLDVNLKGFIDGVETAQLLRKEGIIVPTIYLTANTDQATFERARTTGPRAFLSKPCRKQELARAIALAVDQRVEEVVPAPVAGTGAAKTHLLSDRIFVRHKDRMVKLFLDDIHYVEAERAYCRIQTQEPEYLLSIALGRLVKQLGATHFCRVHRSYVVNLRHVQAIAENHLVIGSRAIPIGKSYREGFFERVNLIR